MTNKYFDGCWRQKCNLLLTMAMFQSGHGILVERINEVNRVFFQNEGIFVHLDELDELDRITHA